MNFAWADPLLGRWNALGVRERRALVALGAFLGVVFFYLLIWSPVHEGLARARARASVAQGQLAQMQEQAATVARLRSAPRATTPANLPAAIEQAAERNGVRTQLKRAEAEGNGGVRVQFDDARFSAVLACLVDLHQRSGLRAERATFERQSNPGMVNAQLLLRARGP